MALFSGFIVALLSGLHGSAIVEYSKNKRQAEKTSGNGKTANNKQIIIEFITQKGIAKTAEIADAVGLSQPRVRVLLAELVAEGIVEPQGEGRARVYTSKV